MSLINNTYSTKINNGDEKNYLYFLALYLILVYYFNSIDYAIYINRL
jgi:hypothetical protein